MDELTRPQLALLAMATNGDIVKTIGNRDVLDELEGVGLLVVQENVTGPRWCASPDGKILVSMTIMGHARE